MIPREKNLPSRNRSIPERLDEINTLVSIVKIQDAETLFRELLEEIDPTEKNNFRELLKQTLDRFHKKRRSALFALFDLPAETPLPPISEPPNLVVKRRGSVSSADFRARLRNALYELSEQHIFQWSSFYRDLLRPLFSESLRFDDAELQAECVTVIKSEIREHAREIFTKGFIHLRQTNPSANSVIKSLTGLQSFIELLIAFYSAHVRGDELYQSRALLRRTYSAALCGVLTGYTDVQLKGIAGRQVLPRYPQVWAHYIGFLTCEDLAELISLIEPGEFTSALSDTLSVAVGALDALANNVDNDLSVLPRLGEFAGNDSRLDISLQQTMLGADPTPIVLRCYTDPSQTTLFQLEESSKLARALVITRLRANVFEVVESREKLRGITVNVASGNSSASTSRAVAILKRAIAERNTALSPTAAINYNHARDFPLNNPVLRRYFHVYRASIRKLLGNFEPRNGVRLWCSVRRSGKTTACFDLGTTTGHSLVVSQTCDETVGKPDADQFYRQVLRAMDGGNQISPHFFAETVERCATSRGGSNPRYVFVLDEYETLFERMNLRQSRDKEIRYAVIQPLLNQMVAFSKDNLLVFVGQRPDAHFIMMDQNQLSAYVQQDSFPLFEHGSESSEFEDLIRKIATEYIPFDATFSNAVHAETSGHPFLTVKVMIDFFDWLIEIKRPLRNINLCGADFDAFSSKRLRTNQIALNPGYDFFRKAISGAMSEEGKKHTPWLHAVYAVIQQISLEAESLRVSLAEYYELIQRVDRCALANFSPDDILRTGTQANFFALNDEHVSVKIPILARISLAAKREVQW